MQVSANLFRKNEFGRTTRLLDWGSHIPKRYNNLIGGSLDNLDRDLLIEEHRIHRRRCEGLREERTEKWREKGERGGGGRTAFG